MARQMKDSGLEWIGHIPEDWSVRMLFQIFSEVKNKNEGLIENNLLSLSYGKIKRKNIDSSFGLLPESFEGYNIIEKDDIVLRLTDLQNDQKSLRTGLAREKGIVTSAYTTLRLRTAAASPIFLHHCLHVFDVCKGFYGMGAGVRQGLNWSGIRKLAIPWCEEEEQRVISSYLDTKCVEIDKVVEQTRATIEEYKKLKQAIITEAVTKGVRGPRPMKPSGVEWIGDIPEEWSKDKIGRVCNLIGSGTTPKFDRFDLSSADIPWIQSGDLSSAHLHNVKTYVTRDIIAAHSALKVYEPPFIAVAMYGASIGNTSISSFSACVNQACCVLTPDTFNLSYLYYIIMACKPYFMYQGEGGGQPNISQEKIKQTWIPVPNPIEQQEIATYLDTKCAEIDRIIEKKEQLIEELGSYKKSLIYEYVTGKKEIKIHNYSQNTIC